MMTDHRSALACGISRMTPHKTQNDPSFSVNIDSFESFGLISKSRSKGAGDDDDPRF